MEKNPLLILKIGNRLYEERKSTGFTQKHVAEGIGVTSQWYGKVERGLCRPSMEMLYSLEQKFNYDVTYIITGKRPPKTALDKIVEDCPAEKRYHIETILRSARSLYRDTSKQE